MKNNISVVIPVYNVEKYLRVCIEAVLKQTYMPFEIILVDDGSNDNSGKICDEYSKNYAIIKTIHKENAGLGYARNTGIDNATGDWIVFLDSDDYCSERLLEKLHEKQMENDADVVVGGYKRVDNEGHILYEYCYSETCYKDNSVKEKLLPRFLGSSPKKSDSLSMSVCNCLFSLDIINKYNIRFPSERNVISEDLFFNYDYYKVARKVVLIKETEYFYRVTNGSLTTNYRPNRYKLCVNLYNDMQKKIQNDNMIDLCKYRLMRSMFNYWRMCFAQEQNNISHKKNKDIIKSINIICGDALTKKILREYPAKYLGVAQKAFLFLVKHKCTYIIFMLIKFGCFRVR